MFSPEESKKSKYRNLKFIAIIIAIVLIVGFVIGRPVWAVYSHAMSAKNLVEKAENELTEGNLEEMAFYLSLANQDLLVARKNIKRLTWYKGLPWVGNQVAGLEQLVISASELTENLSELSVIASNILSPLKEKDGQKKMILQRFSESTALLREMRDRLAKTSERLGRISTAGLLPQIKSTFDLLKARLPFLEGTIDKLIIASEIMPGILGYPEEKTYLFLFQNNMELRPSGGFIGTYGILKLKNGEIVSFFTDDSYNLDKNFESDIPTPEPFQIYNKREDWYFRDSNWSPDFRVAAQKAEWFYHLEGGTEDLDGVIAITPTFIEKVLELTGPIEVPGYPYEFTSENFSDQLEFHVEKNFYKFENKTRRKSIIGELGEVLLDRMMNSSQGDFLTLFHIVSESFSEKHVLVYLDDAPAQTVIQKLNWGGEVMDAPSDYFLYVDCNLASLKSDPKVKRTIDYEVDWDGKGSPISKLTMTYQHLGDFDWRTTRYRTYVRVYLPLGSELVRVRGNESEVLVYEELGKTVFAFFKVTEPQTEESVTLEYRLPGRLTLEPYSLYAQKQAGTTDHKLNVDINWNGVEQEFSTDLAKDRKFRLP